MSSTVLTIAVVGLGAGLLLNLLMTLRLVKSQRLQADYLSRPFTLPIGAPVPDLRGSTLDGAPVFLSACAGSKVALLFVSSRCKTCREKMLSLPMLQAAATQAQVTLWLVGMDSAADTKAFVDQFDVPMPVVIPDRDGLRQFNPRHATPFYCYIAATGVLEASGQIGDAAWLKLQHAWTGATQTRQDMRRYM